MCGVVTIGDCIIDEIRPVDLRAMRAAEKASAAQPSGT